MVQIMDQAKATSNWDSAQTKTVVWPLQSNRLTQTSATTRTLKKTPAKSKLWNWDLAQDQANILAGLKKATK